MFLRAHVVLSEAETLEGLRPTLRSSLVPYNRDMKHELDVQAVRSLREAEAMTRTFAVIPYNSLDTNCQAFVLHARSVWASFADSETSSVVQDDVQEDRRRNIKSWAAAVYASVSRIGSVQLFLPALILLLPLGRALQWLLVLFVVAVSCINIWTQARTLVTTSSLLRQWFQAARASPANKLQMAPPLLKLLRVVILTCADMALHLAFAYLVLGPLVCGTIMGGEDCVWLQPRLAGVLVLQYVTSAPDLGNVPVAQTFRDTFSSSSTYLALFLMRPKKPLWDMTVTSVLGSRGQRFLMALVLLTSGAFALHAVGFTVFVLLPFMLWLRRILFPGLGQQGGLTGFSFKVDLLVFGTVLFVCFWCGFSVDVQVPSSWAVFWSFHLNRLLHYSYFLDDFRKHSWPLVKRVKRAPGNPRPEVPGPDPDPAELLSLPLLPYFISDMKSNLIKTKTVWVVLYVGTFLSPLPLLALGCEYRTCVIVLFCCMKPLFLVETCSQMCTGCLKVLLERAKAMYDILGALAAMGSKQQQ